MTRACVRVSLWVAMCLLAGAVCVEATEYKIRVLPNLAGNTYGVAFDINDSGQIVGFSSPTFKDPHQSVCIWDSEGLRSLGPGGGKVSINNSGTVVDSDSVWSDGTSTLLPSLYAETPYYNFFFDINASGKIVGSSPTAYPPDPNNTHAALWDESGIHDLGFLPRDSSSIARGINDRGQIVGESSSFSTTRAVIWNDGKISSIQTPSGYSVCTAHDINNSGLVLGTCMGPLDRTMGSTRSFAWQDGQLLDILDWSDKDGYAAAVNDRGQIVGSYRTIGGNIYTGYIWENGRVTQLPGLGMGANVRGINENGWIVGQAMDLDKQWHAVVWEPVPEPASVLVLLCGVSGMGWIGWRRK